MESREKHKEAVRREADQAILDLGSDNFHRIQMAIAQYWLGRDEQLDLATRLDHLDCAVANLEYENFHTEAEKVARVLWQVRSQSNAERFTVALKKAGSR
jgi:hypothetical protein